MLFISGDSLVEQECNTQPCPGTWGCWSDWSRCSGHARTRSRECVSPEGGSADCPTGLDREEEQCRLEVNTSFDIKSGPK